MKVPEWFWTGVVLGLLILGIGFASEMLREEIQESRRVNEAQGEALASLLVRVDRLAEDVRRLEDRAP